MNERVPSKGEARAFQSNSAVREDLKILRCESTGTVLVGV